MSQPVFSVLVQPVDVIKTIGKVEITKVEVIPFEGAMIEVFSRSAEGEYIRNDTVMMDKSEYLKWLNEDDYLVAFVLEKVGMAQKEVVEPVVVEPPPSEQ